MDMGEFIHQSISPWMRQEANQDEHVISTRIRLARNFDQLTFPTLHKTKDLSIVKTYMKDNFSNQMVNPYGKLAMLDLNDSSLIEKRMLVDKHLISTKLLKGEHTGVLISENEQLSIMINEEDHLRIQLYYPGLQLDEALEQAFVIDDWLEEQIDYAFAEQFGYLTSCPSNVGTGLRASVMLHLPALSHSKKMNQIISIIHQWGFVVRGFFGEGSQSLGHLYQVSNQVTLGKSEQEIVNELNRIITMLIEREEREQKHLMNLSAIAVENKIYRSYGILKYSRILDSREAANRISDVKLGINLGLINDCSHTLLNELILITQPGFLQVYAEKELTERQRDILRATVVRERLSFHRS